MADGWADGLRPDPLLSVWEWADRFRILQSMDSGEKGPYRSSRTPYAREVMDELSPHRASQRIVMATGAQIGKALACDTPIATPDGWTAMGELRLGSQVFDERGQVVNVIATSPVWTDRKCYRVRFSDGVEIVADAGHRWTVTDHGRGGSSQKGVKTLTTQEMVDLGVDVGKKGRKRFSIPMPAPLDLPVQDLPIDPYALGAWLGDGTSSSSSITQHVDDAPHLAEQLRIPREYLRASGAQRMALLQGLMDTDGSCSRGGRCEISSSYPALAADIEELLRSLGFKLTIGRRGKATKFSFMAYLPTAIFRLRRKLDRMVSVEGRRCSETWARRISAIDPVDSVPVRCIAVDSPSRLYLAGRGMVPTHNTSIGLNWIGHTIHLAPAPMLVVMPTVDLGKDFSDQRLAPMIEACPELREKIPPARERDSGNRQLKKEFPGGLLLVRGANAPAGLRSMPIAKLFFDETDAAPADAGGEGSPIDLAIARTRTFPRRKILLTSTPTTPHGVIWREWLSSDQRMYHVPCPHCGEYQVLEWERLRYDPHDLDGVRPQMLCVKCGTGFDETAKAKWYGEDLGRWVKGNPDSEVAGFHLNSLYSPLGWYSWREAVRDYEKAKDQGEQALKAWTNTVLGQPWMDSAETPDWEALYKRREQYPRGAVPVDGVVLTAGVDIQRDRIEVEVVAWSARMESWSVDYVVIPGDTSTIQTDPAKGCPWRDLKALLDKEWPLVGGGGKLQILRAAVDTGDQTATVYQWVREQRDNRILAVKGRDVQSSILGIPTPQDVTVRGKRVRRGIRLWGVGVSVAKTELYGWLRHEPPADGVEVPRGLCHWPEYGETYFLGLTAEELQYTTLRGFRKAQWVKVRPRNEPLDCRVYARAAAASLGVERWDADDWAARCVRAERMMIAQAPEPPPLVTVSADGVAEVPTPPKTKRGGWLSDYR